MGGGRTGWAEKTSTYPEPGWKIPASGAAVLLERGMRGAKTFEAAWPNLRIRRGGGNHRSRSVAASRSGGGKRPGKGRSQAGLGAKGSGKRREGGGKACRTDRKKGTEGETIFS